MRGVILAGVLWVTALLAEPALAGNTPYEDMGGSAGIRKIVDVEIAYHLKNPRIKKQFDDTNIDRLKDQLVIFICQVTGGPVNIRGMI